MISEEDKQLVVNFIFRSTKLMHGHLPHVLTPAKERRGGGGLEISSNKNDYYCYLKKKILKDLKDPEKRLGRAAQINEQDKNQGSCICQLNFPCWRLLRSCCRALLTIF